MLSWEFSTPGRATPELFLLRMTDDGKGHTQSRQLKALEETYAPARHYVLMVVSRPIRFRGEPPVNEVKGNLPTLPGIGNRTQSSSAIERNRTQTLV